MRLRHSTLYFFQLDGLKCRITTHSLTIWSKTAVLPRGINTTAMLESAATAQIHATMAHAAGLLGLGLESIDRDVAAHIAHQGDEGATDADSRKHRISVPDPQDNKERFRVD